MNLYLQVSRGTEAGRNHAPTPGLAPTVFMMCSPPIAEDPSVLTHGLKAITLPDPRWRRCDIKSTALLGNVLAKGAAVRAGVTEAILTDAGRLREGASTSVLIAKDGVLRAPPYGPEILPGTTRDLILKLAVMSRVPIEIAPIAVEALAAADEILLCFASRGVLPVTTLDGRPVGDGAPGPLWRTVYASFLEYRRRLAGTPPL
jgi:D-alanine transaminase